LKAWLRFTLPVEVMSMLPFEYSPLFQLCFTELHAAGNYEEASKCVIEMIASTKSRKYQQELQASKTIILQNVAFLAPM
jgi:hypothetical protein